VQEHNFKKILITGVSHTQLNELLSAKPHQNSILSEKLGALQFVVTGTRSAVEACEEELLRLHKNALCEELAVEGGLYADLVSTSNLNFKQYLEKVEFKNPQIECFSPANAADLLTAQQIKEFIVELPFLYQDRVQLIERYAACSTLVVPFADESLRTALAARYPEKNIITLR
jgi:malonyl CoA-acyl carrier protein transacylase